MKRKPLIILAAILVLAAIWFSTVYFQKPPQYPYAQVDINTYFDDYQPDYTVTKAELIEDVDTLITYTEELHADAYRMITKEAFLEKAEEIKAQISTVSTEDIPVLDAWYYLQELIVSLEDGHTTMYPLNWEKTVDSRFPLTLTSIESRLFVRDNYGDNNIPERAEILAVNGVTIEQMMDDVMKYVPSTLIHHKYTRFADPLFFELFIQTYFKMTSPWQITYQYNGATTTSTIEGITQASFEKANSLQTDYMRSEINVDGKAIPVLELNFLGFAFDSEWDDYKTFVDDFFVQNKDEPYLIIDVRQNLGGDGDFGYYVLSYLASPGTLQGYKEFSFIVSPGVQKIAQYGFHSAYYDMGFIPKFLWGLPLYKLAEPDQDNYAYWKWRNIFEAEPDTYYQFKWEDSKSYLADETVDRFQGKVFLLTSHETFSAGTIFAGLFQLNNLGTIVGRETGGRVYLMSDINYALAPNSNLTYLVPMAKYIVSDDDPDRGVIPDFTVNLTPEDYVNFRDKDIEQVIELIKEDLAVTNSNASKTTNR